MYEIRTEPNPAPTPQTVTYTRARKNLMQWQIGDAKVTLLLEGLMSGTPVFGLCPFIGQERPKESDLDWMIPDFLNEDYTVRQYMQSYLVQLPDKNILIDTGALIPGYDYFGELEAAGCKPEDIDYVLFTHLHSDHVAHNVYIGYSATLMPTFPKARYIMVKEQYDHVNNMEKQGIEKKGKEENIVDRINFLAIWPFKIQLQYLVEYTNMVDFVDADFQLDELSLFPMPGHIAGHTGIRLESKGEKAVWSGDSIGHMIQLAYPTANMFHDYDQEAGIQARVKLMEELAGTNTVLFPNHVAAVGLVYKDENGVYRINEDNPYRLK